ncbi:hypothetical protein [Ruegeria hyattellae]|uniref:hypothetical protein n=1 Tax=Ruegeria hyattellae TaxID=3233337 RepID=UPI00355BC7E1
MLYDTHKELSRVRTRHLRAGITPALFEMDALSMDELRADVLSQRRWQTRLPTLLSAVKKLLALRLGAHAPTKTIAPSAPNPMTPAE